MRVDVVTLFPRFFEPIVNGSILGRAQAKGLVRITIHDLRSFIPPGERADDSPYGGGPGMVMRLKPLISCIESLFDETISVPENCVVIVPSPAGIPFDHSLATRLGTFERIILVCGHYEGIDERFFNLVKSVEISLGDFVLTGGEIAALAFLDATVRLIPGVIRSESSQADSFSAGQLDWPQFTRPKEFRGIAVPDVLLSGNHAQIAAWRRETARARTRARRADLLTDH